MTAAPIAPIAPCPDPHVDDDLEAIRATIDIGLKRHRAEAAKDRKQRDRINAGLKALIELGRPAVPAESGGQPVP